MSDSYKFYDPCETAQHATNTEKRFSPSDTLTWLSTDNLSRLYATLPHGASDADRCVSRKDVLKTLYKHIYDRGISCLVSWLQTNPALVKRIMNETIGAKQTCAISREERCRRLSSHLGACRDIPAYFDNMTIVARGIVLIVLDIPRVVPIGNDNVGEKILLWINRRGLDSFLRDLDVEALWMICKEHDLGDYRQTDNPYILVRAICTQTSVECVLEKAKKRCPVQDSCEGPVLTRRRLL